MLKLPLYLKATVFLVGLYVFVSILSLAQDIILPLLYATIVAILISPVVDYLVEKKKVNRALSIAGVLLLTLLILSGIITLLLSQASLFHQAMPKLVVKLQELLKVAIAGFSGYFDISQQKINNWVSETLNELNKNRNAAIGSTLSTMGGIISATVLSPVYIFMILYYEPHLLAFAHKVFGANNDNKVSEILSETKAIIKGYISGLFVEFVIIAILNSIGLLALKIEYAVLLGVIGAVLNVIPIIGGIICVGLFVIIALLTKSPVYMLYVVGLYTVIQFIDNHYIFPKIVGSKVKLNLLISVVAVIAGDALWGIPGMFLAIPLTAVIKLVFDRFESLAPWGYLLGSPPQDDAAKGSFSLPGFISSLVQKLKYKNEKK